MTPGDGGMISDLSGLGRIGDALISAFQNAVGTLYRPIAIRAEGRALADTEAYKIVKLAEAQQQAQMILDAPPSPICQDGSEPDNDIALRKRAGDRLVRTEMRRQVNLENIFRDSLEIGKGFEEDGAEARPIDEDWMSAFINYAQNVSEHDIRRLWSRILASQAVAGRSKISRATLDALRLLEPEGAKLFERIARIFYLTGQIMSVESVPALEFNIDSLEAMQLFDIGFLRRIDTRESNLDINGGVLVFLGRIDERRSPEYLVHHHTQYESLARELKLDRCLLTGRGFELATILFPNFYEIIVSGGNSEDGAYADATQEILGEWALDLSERGVLVCRSELDWKTEMNEQGQERRSSMPRIASYFDPQGSRWRRLPADITPVYKIVDIAEWRAAKSTGSYAGSSKDKADGFIHLSKAWQLEGTLDKHYSKGRDLCVVAIDGVSLEPALKYEPSRNGELFPHLYQPLPMWAVTDMSVLHFRDGAFALPKHIRAMAERYSSLPPTA